MGRKPVAALALLCLAMVVVMSGCDGWGPGAADLDRGSDGSSGADFTISTTLVSEDRLYVQDLVQVQDSLVALATTEGSPGGLLLRSGDGGLSWSEFPTPLPDAISGSCPPIYGNCGWTSCSGGIGPGCDLMAAGPWLIAVRSSGSANHSLTLDRQAVFISEDHGTTWQLVDLPAPPGTAPFVWTAVEVDGRLMLGGTTLAFFAPGDHATLLAPAADPDVALWVSSDPATGFDRLAARQFDGVSGSERINELIRFEDRLIAVGAQSHVSYAGCCLEAVQVVAHQSRDNGVSWQPMTGLPADALELVDAAPTLVDGNLVIRAWPGQVVLEPGSDRWTVRPERGGLFAPFANEVGLPDGSIAVTWDDQPAGCECSLAYAGHIEDERLVSSSDLDFESCRSDSGANPSTRSFAPGIVGEHVVAITECDGVAWLAFSFDGAHSWDTMPLPGPAEASSAGLAPASSGPFPQWFLFLPEGVLVALMSIPGTLVASGPEVGLSQIAAVRIAVEG